MRTQKRIFTILSWLAFLWIILGFIANANNPTTAPDSNAGQMGRALGDMIVVGFFMCSGLPVLLMSLFMRWRCIMGLREQSRHEELIASHQSTV